MKDTLNSLTTTAGDFSSGMGRRKLTVFAASGCYYLFMSLVPIVMIMCCILPYTPISQSLVVYYINTYFAESLGAILLQITNAIYSSNAATLTVSILLTLYSASASMKALMNGMDAAYGSERKSNIVIFTLQALLYMIILVVSIVLSLVIMVYGGRILLLIRRYIANVGPLAALLSGARYLLVMVILTLIFTLVYTYMPSVKLRMIRQLPGGIFAAVTWVLFSYAFTIYINISDKYGAYGFIGTIMVAMMWMYYCLFFLLIGGYLNSYLMEKTAEDNPENCITAEEAPVNETDSQIAAEEAMANETDSQIAAEEATANETDSQIAAEEAMANETDSQITTEDVTANLSEIPGAASISPADECGRQAVAPELTEDQLLASSDSFDTVEQISDKKKKLPLPLIIAACSVAALGAIFFFIIRKKSSPKPASLIIPQPHQISSRKIMTKPSHN